MNLVCMHCLYENFNVIKWFTFCLHAATASGLFFRFCFLQLEVAGPHCHRVSSFRNESVLLVCQRFSAQLIPEVPVGVNEVAEHAVKQKIREGLFFFPPESQKTLTELTALNTHTHTLNRAVKSFDWSVIALLHKMPNARQAWRISLRRRLTLSL